MARADCTQRTYCSEYTLKFLCILVDVQQRHGALKMSFVKRDHVPQSAMLNMTLLYYEIEVSDFMDIY